MIMVSKMIKKIIKRGVSKCYSRFRLRPSRSKEECVLLEASRARCDISSLAGQAAAEMAILGTLILICFSVLLTYGQRLDVQQQLKMEAFRRALQKAYERNSSVSYTMEKDVRLFSLFGGFGEGQGSTLNSTASVMWQKGFAGEQGTTNQTSFAFYQINDEIIGNENTGLPRYEKTVIGHQGNESDVMVPVSVWKEDARKIVRFSSTSGKEEEKNTGTIINTQDSDFSETVRRQLYVRWDRAETDARNRFNTPNYRYEGTYGGPYEHGAYYNQAINRTEYSAGAAGTTIHRHREWTTD
jgi:hypothetical protein